MIRNFIGLIITVVGAFIFQIGFRILTDDMQEIFAEKWVKGFLDIIKH